MEKTCKGCGNVLPLSAYHPNRSTRDGTLGKCKACVRAAGREYKRLNSETVKQSHAYYQKSHRAQSRAYTAGYKRRNRALVSAKYRQYEKANPEKYRAHKAVRNAVARGTLVKPSHCQQCGAPKEPRMLHGHHRDYTKRLDVTWLCAYCHWLEHEAARDRKGATK